MGRNLHGKIAGLACIATAGCSLLVSLDDLREPADASGVDAPNDAGDGAATDSSDVVIPPLACPSPDAGVAFCDDFDDSDASAFTHWSSTYATVNATVTRALSDASSPFAAHFATSPNPDGGSPQSELQRMFLTPPFTRVTYAFSVRVGQYAGGLHIAPVTLRKGDPLSSVDYLSISATGTTFSEQIYTDAGTAVYGNHALTDTLASGKWVHVKIEWTLGDAGNSVLVSYDGAAVTNPITLDARSVFGAVQVAAGISSVVGYSDAGSQIDVDDVVVTVQ